MPFKPDLVDEVNVLIKFKDSTQEGIKVHKTAAPTLIAATERLFDKGMITQKDGGYLTPRGLIAVEHAHTLHDLLSSTKE